MVDVKCGWWLEWECMALSLSPFSILHLRDHPLGSWDEVMALDV